MEQNGRIIWPPHSCKCPLKCCYICRKGQARPFSQRTSTVNIWSLLIWSLLIQETPVFYAKTSNDCYFTPSDTFVYKSVQREAGQKNFMDVIPQDQWCTWVVGLNKCSIFFYIVTHFQRFGQETGNDKARKVNKKAFLKCQSLHYKSNQCQYQ